MATTARIEMRVDNEVKAMAERAAAALGCASLTEFMVRLVRENAPRILEQEAAIEVTNAQFDRFIALCEESSREPSAKILEAARRLDKEGY